ncbi:MAG: energy transducer TonB [Sandaracinaceae bacterium]
MLDDFSDDASRNSSAQLGVASLVGFVVMGLLLWGMLRMPWFLFAEVEVPPPIEIPSDIPVSIEPPPEPEEPPLPDEPPPEPEPAIRRGEELRPEIEQIEDIPEDVPEESEGELDEEEIFNPETEGSPDGVEGGALPVRPPPVSAPVAAPPPPPPARVRRGPVRLPANATPPDCAGQPVPDPGAAIRAAGIPSVRIIMRLTFDATGRVTEARVLRGHELVPSGNLERTFRQWRCEPARLPSGEAIAVVRTLPVNIVTR